MKTTNDIITGNGRVLIAYVYPYEMSNFSNGLKQIKLNPNKVEFKILTKLGHFHFFGMVLSFMIEPNLGSITWCSERPLERVQVFASWQD